MATFKFNMPDELITKLSRLGDKTDDVCKKALEAGAEILKDAVSESLSNVIGQNTKYKSRSTGELQDALGVTSVKADKDGNLNIKVGFKEPRKNGKSNAQIANTIEFGKKGQPPKPFLKSAKTKSKSKVEKAMIEVLESEVNKI